MVINQYHIVNNSEHALKSHTKIMNKRGREGVSHRISTLRFQDFSLIKT